MKRGFISYAHSDEKMFDVLRKQLKPVEKSLGIEFWVDKKIRAGDKWHNSIAGAMEVADVFLACISCNFIWSEYIEEFEIPKMQQRANEGAIVIPVIFKDVIWDHLPIAMQQAVPKGAKPIQLWQPKSTGYADAARQIRASLSEAWS